MSLSWEAIAEKAQQHRDATIALVQPPIPDITNLPLDSTPIPATILTAEEISITESEPTDLVNRLSTGALTSTTVTNAFLRRAGLAQKLVNCVTELLPSTALARAAFLDDYLKKNGKPIGPLHGLPISVKEHIGMEGLTLNAGFVAWHDRVADANAHILDILVDAGAVLYVRTTEPQTLMHLETDNNLYGVTVNPFNRNLSPGGSSGGEGALIGLRGSCLGIGSDIGGSIRSPAANNGLYGLRPTSYRLPLEGLSATMLGQDHIVPVVGPMTTSLSGIKLFMKTLIDAKPWLREHSLLPFPWRTDPQLAVLPSGNKKLKVGIMYDDGVVKPHPPITRALRSVAVKLGKVKGVEIVEWEPYKHDLAWSIISTAYFGDGGEEESAAVDASGEPWRPLSTFILKENPGVKKLSVTEIWSLNMAKYDYKSKYAKRWVESGIDVLLCPVGPGVAPAHDTSKYWGYTAQWNLLDYPGLVVPIDKVDEQLDVKDIGYEARNEKDKWNHELYDADKYRNAPISLQLVANRYQDEMLIEAGEYILEKIGAPWVKYV
ncbi:putative glutamyl-tRNA amidotransferase subunit A [Pleomassaria siparia CBS 279.74]|uniref:amidase n=1 Tax=Pleomassaria siparia CBS 279.74 TaxID=1314801 RepID=A0A6G1K9N6_9PLEO|nr:putative glutamyl-tRNA amidotransferase subunit A [Pleomassaria siparia CBS 279.74]